MSEMHFDASKIKANQFCNLAVEAEMAIKVGEMEKLHQSFQ